MARESDEESGVQNFGSSPHGTASATEFTSDTFQISSRMGQSASRCQYHGIIPKPDVGHYSLQGILSGPISLDERYLLGVSSN